MAGHFWKLLELTGQDWIWLKIAWNLVKNAASATPENLISNTKMCANISCCCTGLINAREEA